MTLEELSPILKEIISHDNYLHEEGKKREYTRAYNALSQAMSENLVKFSLFPSGIPIFCSYCNYDYEESNLDIKTLNLKEIEDVLQQGGCGTIFYQKIDTSIPAYLLIHCFFDNKWTIYKI